MAYETHVEIAAPADRVWATMIDVERWPQWTRSMSSVERLDDGPFGPGSRVKAKQPRMPAATWTVDEFEAGKRFTWTASGPGFTTTAEHELTTLDDGGVRVRLAVAERGPIADCGIGVNAPLRRTLAGRGRTRPRRQDQPA